MWNWNAIRNFITRLFCLRGNLNRKRLLRFPDAGLEIRFSVQGYELIAYIYENGKEVSDRPGRKLDRAEAVDC